MRKSERDAYQRHLIVSRTYAGLNRRKLGPVHFLGLRLQITKKIADMLLFSHPLLNVWKGAWEQERTLLFDLRALHGYTLLPRDECSPSSQQRAGEACRRGQPVDAGSQGPPLGLSAGRRPSNLAQLAEDDLWTVTLSVSWVRMSEAQATAVEIRRLVYCLFVPGWTLTWFNNGFLEYQGGTWRIIWRKIYELHL